MLNASRDLSAEDGDAGIPESGSRLDFTGATIHVERNTGPEAELPSFRSAAPDIVLPHQEAEYVRHIAIDIGGSLIKLVYFSSRDHAPDDLDTTDSDSDNRVASSSSALPEQLEPTEIMTTELLSPPSEEQAASRMAAVTSSIKRPSPATRGGRLHFVKFETKRVEDAVAFIEQKRLHRPENAAPGDDAPLLQVRATGGGSHRFADLFKERLGVILKKEDEMACLVTGCNFLLRAVQHEAFHFSNGKAHFLSETDGLASLFPYLLVNIGSGVSMIKVDGPNRFKRISGTNLGGGTFWGLCRLLTRVRSFDEMLELSSTGNSANVDMLVGDIYGGRDYENIGLSADTIASSFGKVVSQDKELEDYNPADIALALCRLVSYNIAHLAFLNATLHGVSRVFFGGFFIRGHPYTMDVISYAIRFWSGGKMEAAFLRHEGFLGAMGAFLKGHPLHLPTGSVKASRHGYEAAMRARFSERFAGGPGASLAGADTATPPFASLSEKVDWIEKYMAVGAAATEAAREEHEANHGTLGSSDIGSRQASLQRRRTASAEAAEAPQSLGEAPSGQALSGAPSCTVSEPPGTPRGSARPVDLSIGVLHYSPGLEPFPLLADPGCYRPDTYDFADPEERAFWLDMLEARIPLIVEKAIGSAGGAHVSTRRRAHAMGAALRMHLHRLRGEPACYGPLGLAEVFELREDTLREFRFYDIHAQDKQRENLAAAAVLSDLIHELDTLATRPRLLSLLQGVLAGNVFDWGACACVTLYHDGTILEMYQKARCELSARPWRVDDYDAFEAAVLRHEARGVNSLGRAPTPFRRVLMFIDNAGADAVLGMIPLAREFLCMGAEVILAANSQPAINDVTAPELEHLIDTFCAPACRVIEMARRAARSATDACATAFIPPYPGMLPRPGSRGSLAQAAELGSDVYGSGGADGPGAPKGIHDRGSSVGAVGSPDLGGAVSSGPGSGGVEPKLFVCGSGGRGPCLDLRAVSREVAEASQGVDLVVIEGMGRAVHTNYHARFKCAALKMAMIKTERVAERLFRGKLFDCVCRYDPPSSKASAHDA